MSTHNLVAFSMSRSRNEGMLAAASATALLPSYCTVQGSCNAYGPLFSALCSNSELRLPHRSPSRCRRRILV